MICVYIFSPSNELIIFISTDCCFVEMTSYFLNPNLVLYLRAKVFVQTIITLIANFPSTKILLDCSLVLLLI